MTKKLESIDKKEVKNLKEKYRNLKDFEEIIRDFSIGIFTIDEKGKVITSNTAMLDILGNPDEDEINVFELEPVLNSELYEVFQRTLQTGEGVEASAVYTSFDGKELYLNIKTLPRFDTEGRVTGLTSVIEDITEKAKLEHEIKKLADITNASADAIVGLGVFGRIESWNKGAEDIFGYSRAEITGEKFDRLFPEEAQKTAEELWKEIFKKGFVRNFETYQRHKDGRLIPVNITATAVKDDRGNITSISAVMKDLTEKKKLEEELKRYNEELKRSNELKDLFTDILRHDLLNPIGVVKNFSEFLLDGEHDEETNEQLKCIKRNIDRAIGLIEAASKFAKLESAEKLEFEKRDLSAIFKEVVQNFEHSLKDKKMKLEFNANKACFAEVSSVIEDVFSNLLSNAIKYSPEGSKIIIGIEDEDKVWKVSVKDYGEGIQDEAKIEIFERFKRRDKAGVKGTGLGLAIVKRIVEIHNGKAWVEDNPEGGSIFFVTIPKKKTLG